MGEPPVIVWFRLDLRTADNPALASAAATGAPVLPIYVLDEAVRDGPLGGAGRWWLHRSLEALSRRLEALGTPLMLCRGSAGNVIPELVQRMGARAVYWNRRYEPDARARDDNIEERLRRDGFAVETFNASLLFEPSDVRTGAGDWYKVFTPFWRACLARPAPDRPLPAPTGLRSCDNAPAGETLAEWNLLPETPDWASAFGEQWQPGEEGARAALERFVEQRTDGYTAARDLPALDATSRLSPCLHWGEIGPRQVWHAVDFRTHAANADGESARKFLAELGWREFSYHLLGNFPDLPERNFRPAFDGFPWRDDDAGFERWCRGRTGFPFVDAGMRQLWRTGWMHNRVRMVAASFLVKDLLVDWRRGMAWFEDTLVDADLASNAASWQWVAGSSADAAPYFRIFNPAMQGEKFDPDGNYVRRWVPELAGLPKRWIHRPWEAPEEVLAASGIRLGGDYPDPCVDHAAARRRALSAFDEVKVA